MKIEVEQLSPVERKVSVEVPWETVRDELDEAYRALSKRAKVKGFRPGKVPRKVLEQMYRQTVEGEVINRVIDDGFRKAVEENDLFPIDRPRLDDVPRLEADQPLRFEARVEVKPEVQASRSEGLEVEREVREITDDEVEAELMGLREKAVVVEPITDRQTAQEGDLAVVDFFGFVDGETFKGGKGISYTVQLGAKEMIPGFEDAIVGMAIGDQKEFQLPFPPDVGPEEVRGKTVDWKVDLKELKQKIYPDLDDEFAKDLGEFDTLDELKVQIRENLATREDAKQRRGLKESALLALVEANPIEVPSVMVDRQVGLMLQDAEASLQKNPNPAMKEAIDRVRVELRPQAEKRVAGMLLLEAVAREHGLEITPEELDSRLGELAREHRMPVKQVRQQLRANDQLESLKYNMLQDKALEWVLERAKVVDKAPEPPEAPENEGESTPET